MGQRLTVGTGSGVLPHNRRVYGDAGQAIPDDRRFPLIRDADGRYGAIFYACFTEYLTNQFARALQNLNRIMLYPAGLGKKLRVLGLGRITGLPVMIEQDAPCAGCTLINGKYVLFHGFADDCIQLRRLCREVDRMAHSE